MSSANLRLTCSQDDLVKRLRKELIENLSYVLPAGEEPEGA